MKLFDCNGHFGKSVAAKPEFPRIEDYIAHMERLGIGRSLLWNSRSRDQHPGDGNHELREIIKAQTGGRDRLKPAYAIDPSMIYECGALEELVDDFESGVVRALRIFPSTARFPPRQIAPILRKLDAFKPLVLCSVNELGAASEGLAELAGEFREINFVITHSMWPFFATALNLMERHDNILLENSWLHVNGAIELVCRRFGATRLLFGLGHITHNGASAAALAEAEISESDRDLISHQNLERLLCLKDEGNEQTGKGATISGMQYYRRYMESKPLGVEIIDAHGHFQPTGLWMLENQRAEDQIPKALKDMDRAGISRVIVSGFQALFSNSIAGNDALEKSLIDHCGRFSGYVVFHPCDHLELEKRLDDWFSRDFFVGFKVFSDYWRVPLTDPRHRKMWEYANRFHLPILMHTWEGPYNSPALLREIVPAHPNAHFILGHSGGGDRGRLEAEALAADHQNVHLEFCGSFTASRPFEETIRRVGSGQILFGSDAVVHSFGWELGRYLSMDLPEELLLPGLGANMRKILADRRREA